MALEDFTDQEFADEFQCIMRDLLVAYEPKLTEQPKAYLLGGQSGAGKTTLHKIIRAQDSNGIISIIGDDYRKKHPRFYELQLKYGDAAVDYTAKWAGQMTEALVDALSAIGYNLIVEGTLRTAEVPTMSATLLRERGYDVSLALMAVKPEISLVSCRLRYEEMRLAGTTPRATDPAHHNKIIEQIVNNLEVLEKSDLFDGIYLYTRSRECLFPRKGFDGTASEALREALFGPWTPEEEDHLRYLEAKLERLKAQG